MYLCIKTHKRIQKVIQYTYKTTYGKCLKSNKNYKCKGMQNDDTIKH